jgi:hypothetical protein
LALASPLSLEVIQLSRTEADLTHPLEEWVQTSKDGVTSLVLPIVGVMPIKVFEQSRPLVEAHPKEGLSHGELVLIGV